MNTKGRILTSLALIAGLGFSSQLATASHACKGFLPENNLNIPVGTMNGGGITEEQFNWVLDKLEATFKADVERVGDKLSINRLWSNGTVNASAQRMGKTQVLNMYGGLARHQETNLEGFAIVACHEFGHHNGGAPKMGGWFSPGWATNEGGSDYYATLKCMRRLFADEDNAAALDGIEIDPFAREACETAFTDIVEVNICLRSALGGQSVANLFHALGGYRGEKPSFTTPDPSVVRKTDNSHPASQCRLDTYFQGAICAVAVNNQLSNDDYKEGSCYTGRDSSGTRPLCWFKPD